MEPATASIAVLRARLRWRSNLDHLDVIVSELERLRAIEQRARAVRHELDDEADEWAHLAWILGDTS